MKTIDELGRTCSKHDEFLMDVSDDTGLSVPEVKQMVADFIVVLAHGAGRSQFDARASFWDTVLNRRSEIYPLLLKAVPGLDKLHTAAEGIRASLEYQRREQRFNRAIRDLSRFADRLSRTTG